MKKVFKLGLDLHGVSDRATDFFSLITKLLVDNGHEVHLMTGSHKGERLDQQLEAAGVTYTHLFSISDFLYKSGNPVRYDENNNPWFSDEEWNEAKSIYAKQKKLDLSFDDTEVYGDYFEFPFAFIKIDMKDEKDT